MDPSGAVAQFLSYEGVMAGVGGPADGLVSTDLGVEEPSDTSEGRSLGLTGSGRAPADFAWTAGPATPGALNAGQTARVVTAADTPAGSPALGLGPPVPNPSAGTVRFALSLPSPTVVRAVVVDALGRAVAVVYHGPAAGTVPLAVDGRRLVPGAYALDITTADGTVTRRFTVAR